LKPRPPRNSIPVYYRLKKLIQEKIENGTYEPGVAIPTEKILAEDNQVSIGTVKKALLELVNEGYLYRIQGKGTFVCGTVLRRPNLRYYQLIKDFGQNEAGLKIKLIERLPRERFEPVASHLRLRKNQHLYEVRRVFTFEERPLIYTVSHFPRPMFKGFMDLPTSFFEKGTLYEALERSYGLPTIFNQELFGVSLSDRECSRILGISEGTPIQYIEMLSFTYRERPYEYRKTYCLTNKRKIFRET
jgi:GntR family transcriptional regulator